MTAIAMIAPRPKPAVQWCDCYCCGCYAFAVARAYGGTVVSRLCLGAYATNPSACYGKREERQKLVNPWGSIDNAHYY